LSKKQNEYRKLFNNWKKSNVGKTGIDFLKKKQRFMCPNCFNNLNNGYHVHHLIPISKLEEQTKFLAIDLKNLVLLCPSCNLAQGNKIDTRFDD